MISIDQLLCELFKQTFPLGLPIRDLKVLESMHRQMLSGNFLTKNQGNLLLKIFTENEVPLREMIKEEFSLTDPTWSQPFRIIDQIRKIFINNEKSTNELIIEFTYNKDLRRQIAELGKIVQGQIRIKSAKQYSIPFTEKNILLVINAFKNKKFNIESQLLQYYQEIKSFIDNKPVNFDILTITNTKLLKLLCEEIGEIDAKNILLYDRQHKFQYQVSTELIADSLSKKVAARKSTNVWINSESNDLTNIIGSLIELKRLPLLVIFDSHNSELNLSNLNQLRNTLEYHNITSDVGIYFRVANNNDTNKILNVSIAEYGYNKRLTNKTLVAGIVNNKLPKFLMTEAWYPRSILSFTNTFKNNKASTYASAVDLILYYNKFQPLLGGETCTPVN